MTRGLVHAASRAHSSTAPTRPAPAVVACPTIQRRAPAAGRAPERRAPVSALPTNTRPLVVARPRTITLCTRAYPLRVTAWALLPAAMSTAAARANSSGRRVWRGSPAPMGSRSSEVERIVGHAAALRSDEGLQGPVRGLRPRRVRQHDVDNDRVEAVPACPLLSLPVPTASDEKSP
jgi:hypothetical protein